MGSEINNERARNAQELRDMQDTYRKKKQEIKEQGEQDLDNTREGYNSKIRHEKRESEAVVNHLRNESRERTEQIKDSTDKKLIYERNHSAQRLQAERDAGTNRVEGLKKGIEQKQDALTKTQQEINSRENDLRKRESEDTAQIQREHVKIRQEISKSSAKEVQELNERSEKAKLEMRRKDTDEMRKLQEHHKAELENFKKESTETYQRTRQFGQAQLKQEQEGHNTRIEAERQAFLQRQAQQKQLTTEALVKEQTEGEQRLTGIQKTNKTNLEQERLKGADEIEKTRQVFGEEIARQHKMGDQGIADQKATHEYKMNRILEAQHQQAQEIQKEHQQKLIEEDERFKSEAQRNSNFYKETLLQRHKEYVDAQTKAHAAFADNIQLQKENMTKSLEKEKREALDTVGKYRDRQTDPFYRLNKAQAQINETDTHYIIQAEVPEHEKDNVKLFLHKDRAILQGHRRFQDEIKEPEGKLTTSNYQTFRQEIPLERPVHEKLVSRSYSNGVLTLKVPKV